MTNALHLAKITAAKEAISDAEKDLEEVIGNLAVVVPAEAEKVSEAVRVASLKLSDARAKLDELESSLAQAKLEAARAAIREAETYLDKVLREIVVVPGADTSWVSKVVRDAFTKLKLATRTFAELESPGTNGG